MLAALFLKKRERVLRVLLVSHKKPAIDVVFAKLRQFLGAGSAIYATNESAQRQQMRGELQQWLARCGTLHGHAELEELRRKRAHHRGKVEQLRAELDKLEKSIKDALEWERDYYHRQERLDRNRRAYLGRFEPADSVSLKLSPDADAARAMTVLDQVERLLGQDVHASGGSLSRQEVFHLQRFFGACVNQFFAKPARLQPNLTAVIYLRGTLSLPMTGSGLPNPRPRHTRFSVAGAQMMNRKREDLQKQQSELAKAQLAAHIVGNCKKRAMKCRSFAG